MKIKAIRNYIHNKKSAMIGDEYEIEEKDGKFLIEHGYAVRVDEPEVIGEQFKLDNPAFGVNDTPLKSTPKKGRKKKNA